MRAHILILGFALAVSAQPLPAQTSAPDKAPRAAPSRINSLSPDEARRAERSRKRAAESGKNASATAERKEAAPPPKRETVEEFRHNRDRAAATKPRQPSLTVHKQELVERQEVRRLKRREQREAQRVEPRHERRARVTAPPRIYAARPMLQQPRVGTYVPRGVPLYPLPRRYGYRPGYGPRFYRPRFYGSRYVYGEGRFVYGAPYYGQPGPPPFPGVQTMDGGDGYGQ